MTDKKVKLNESSMRGYSGHLFMTEFKNGETVAPVSQRKQDRILATVRAEVKKDKPKPPDTAPNPDDKKE
ncbi:hypothetical protein KKJ09_13200 [Xenorhabdus bovienii]|uniref:hypothetical protein n=1 Tax=Xenorhabdus bovienii TaxID=40576 RepID=UPI0023B28388|nr:hypothetical protein [Xenorhabdus bovienii]MDE9494516.1 hypothetical protein [Xenorhabdus bovienii]MDE9502913.1 hypothetical protein [Xenorhabdus bovienii]MDE9526563.1 hypothetical protein [Xenorhabdus bovienii]MDE9568838.1 hypothetical protein [Xenorhabdus bovienii]